MTISALGRKLLWSVMLARGQNYNPDDFKRSAIVFSPHQDDETLGCGGLIARKTEAGAQLKLVFMTDGSRSHRGLISETELRAMRRAEAVNAAGVLGVPESDVVFLDIKDGTLMEERQNIKDTVIAMLREIQPQEIFVPYFRESPRDHLATNLIVLQAVRETDMGCVVYEYPIWFFCQWPFVRFTGNVRQTLSLIKRLPLYWFGLMIVRDFKCVLDIRGVLERKQNALACHRSQMTRIVNDRRWLTLNDVFSGDFVKCFFGGREVFFKHQEPNKLGP